MRDGRGALVAIAIVVVLVTPQHGHAASVPCGSLVAPPGALYLDPDAPTGTVFLGNSFAIDGNDITLAGMAGPDPAIFGVAARTDTNTQEVRDGLGAAQADNVTGRDFVPSNPPVPSVGTVGDAPDAATIDAFVAALLLRPHIVSTAAALTGNLTFGTVANPIVMQLVGQGAGVTVKASANVSGAGILVVEDGFTVQGVMTYDGLVIVRGPTTATGVLTVLGSLWTHGTAVTVGGSSMIRYSSEALGLAGAAGGNVACDPPSVCGDGVRAPDEECDDGNAVDGDCCSATCRLEARDTPCAADADPCTADRCDGAGTCRHDVVDAPCDDGDACTAADVCVAGICTGTPVSCGPCMRCDATLGCVGAPATGCRTPVVPAGSRLVIRTGVDAQNHLSWRWRTDQAEPAAFGDPLATDDYRLCLFGGDGGARLLFRTVVPAGGACGESPCWRATSRGYRWANPPSTNGVVKLKLAAGLDGGASIRLIGAGAGLALPPLPLEAPITVQVATDASACWEASYPVGTVEQTDHVLRARGATVP